LLVAQYSGRLPGTQLALSCGFLLGTAEPQRQQAPALHCSRRLLHSRQVHLPRLLLLPPPAMLAALPLTALLLLLLFSLALLKMP
jgi:hypothetical protein